MNPARRWGRRRITVRSEELSLMRRGGRRVRRVAQRLTTGPGLYSRRVGVWLAGLTGGGVVWGWFEGGKHIATGDVQPFLHHNMATELGSLWNHAQSGAGSVTYLIARAYRILIEEGVLTLGGSSAFAQRLHFTLLAALAAAGVAYLVAALLRRPAAIWAAGAFAVINPFMLTRMPNVLILIAIAAGGWAGGILLRAGRGVMRWGWLKLGFVSLFIAEMAYNPPMLAVLAATLVWLAVVAVVAGRPGAWKRVLLTFAGAAPVAVVVNLWWLIPLYYTLFGGLGGAEVEAVLDVSSWQWTHKKNSITASFTMTAHHAFGMEQYYPATRAYTEGLASYILYIIPTAVAGAWAVVRRRPLRRIMWLILGSVGVLVFASKGLHEPFTAVNKWMYETLPGYWLLREPAGKLGPVLITLYAIGLGAILEQLWRPSASRRLVPDLPPRNPVRRALSALRNNRLRSGEARLRQWAAALLCVAGVAAGWPVISGTVIPTERPIFPSGHVTVPEAWYEAADWVNTTLGRYQPGEGSKVMTLPVNDYYQMPTTWGYYGVDGIPAALLEVPLVNHQPGGYYGEQPGYGALLDGVTASVYSGDADRLRRLVDRLGVSHVILRRDIDFDMVAGRSFAEPRLLADGFEQMGLEPVFENEVAAIYHLGDGAALKLYAKAVGTEEKVLEDPSTLRTAFKHLTGDAVIITAGEAGTDASLEAFLESRGMVVAGRIIDAVTQEVGPGAQGRQLIQAGVVGRYVSLEQTNDGGVMVGELGVLAGEAGEVVVGLDRDHSPRSAALIEEEGQQMWLPNFSTIQVHTVSPRAAQTAVCEDRECVWEVELEGESRVGRVRGYLVAVAGSATAPCVYDTTDDPEEIQCWEVIPAADAGTADRKYVVTEPGYDSEGEVRTPARRVVVSVQGAEEVEMVWAEVTPRSETLTVGVPAVVVGETSFTTGYSTASQREPLEGGGELEVGALGELSDCHRVDDAGLAETQLALDHTADGWVLGAERHSACVGKPFEVEGNVPLIEVGVDVTRLEGGFGRLCVYAVNLRRCLPGPSVASLGGELGETIHYEAAFTVPAGERRFEVFTYADSEDVPGRTEVAYENLVIRPSQGQIHLEAVESGEEASPVVVLEESYSDGWILETRDGVEVAAVHVLADGWANGWVLAEEVDLGELVVRFAPQQKADLGVAISAVGIAALLIMWVSAGLRRRRTTR